MSNRSSSDNGEGTSHKDPLFRILDELSSLKLWKEKLERKEKGKERVEKINMRGKNKGRRKKENKRFKKRKNMSPIVVMTLARA